MRLYIHKYKLLEFREVSVARKERLGAGPSEEKGREGEGRKQRWGGEV